MPNNIRLLLLISFLVLFFKAPQSFARDEGQLMEPIAFTTMTSLQALEQEAFAYGRGSYDPDFMVSVAMRPVILKSLLEMASEIMHRFPPEEFDYVSLGRSAAGLAIALEAQIEYRGAQAKVVELPMSGMRDYHFEPHWYEDTLREHFRRHLGSLRERKGRKALVFDYISGGGTLRHFARILQMAQREAWITDNVHILALSEDGSRGFRAVGYDIHNSSRPLISPDRLHLLELPRPLGRSFKFCAFKEFSEYRSWFFRDDHFEACALGARGLKLKEPSYKPAKKMNNFLRLDRFINKMVGAKTRKDFREALDRVHQRFEMDAALTVPPEICELALSN